MRPYFLLMTEQQAQLRLASLCAKGEHCTQEILDKLRKWEIEEGAQARIMAYLTEHHFIDNTTSSPLTIDDKIDILEEQLRINVERIDEYRGIIHTRRHLASSPIFKSIPGFKQTRIAMLRADKQEELIAILEGCRERLRGLEQTVG